MVLGIWIAVGASFLNLIPAWLVIVVNSLGTSAVLLIEWMYTRAVEKEDEGD